MTARAIIKWPNPALLKSSCDVDPQSEDTLKLSSDLYHTMLVSYGAGIAAPQIGVHKNVCVISDKYVPSLPKEEKLLAEGECVVLVNPEITVLGDQTFKWEESCLSVEDIAAPVVRNQKILIKYNDLSGNLIERQVEDIESATIQHETDHLIGKLFIHRLTGTSRQIAMRKLRRKILDQKRASRQVEKNSQGKISEKVRIANRKKRKQKQKSAKKNKRR